MKILVAEDDRVSRRMLETVLGEWGYEVTAVADGLAAWRAFLTDSDLELAILDWLMPGIDGRELCRRVRELTDPRPAYLILLTARGSRSDVVAGLRGGADDYITKPFDLGELEARLHTGRRVLDLQRNLACRVHQLEVALKQVHQLRGLLPICMYCKSIRDSENYWAQVEAYLEAHSGTKFTHGICPHCYDKIVKPELAALERDKVTR
ncbi:MAG TPA: response regulator transcription factor [Gemmataceae bacterium]|nr:response regulator transcription factor [Gemmataceae bacterium]